MKPLLRASSDGGDWYFYNLIYTFLRIFRKGSVFTAWLLLLDLMQTEREKFSLDDMATASLLLLLRVTPNLRSQITLLREKLSLPRTSMNCSYYTYSSSEKFHNKFFPFIFTFHSSSHALMMKTFEKLSTIFFSLFLTTSIHTELWW